MCAVMDTKTYMTMMESGKLVRERTLYDHVNYAWTPVEATRHYQYLLESNYEQNEGPFHLVALKVQSYNMLCCFNRHYNKYSKYLGQRQSYRLSPEELEASTSWSFGAEVMDFWKKPS